MTATQTTLFFNEKDGKVLSLAKSFAETMNFCVRFNVVLIGVFVFILLSCFAFPFKTNKTEAVEPNKQNIEIEIKEKEISNWLEAMRAKYSRYKISYPEKGVIHAKGFYFTGSKPVRVNILEINRSVNSDLIIKPETAANTLSSKNTIRKIAKKENAFAAVNGGYFKPQTGVPLGTLMINGKLLTGSIYNRTGLGINYDGSFIIGKTSQEITVKNKKTFLKLDNINQPRTLSTHLILYDENWGEYSPLPPKYGATITILNGKTIGITTNEKVKIPKSGYVISGPYKALSALINQKNLTLEINLPEYFKNCEHIIGGGPYLVRDGKLFVSIKEEKLEAISGRNPRTLVGYTKENNLIIATVDGRETTSVGMNIWEAAKFMKSLGCEQAMNLDGGSSSAMLVKGQITNFSVAKEGIPVSNALTIGKMGKLANNGTE